MIDRRKYMEEGTKAIIREISREIVNIHEEKFNRITEKTNEYFDEKFKCLKTQISELTKTMTDLNTKGCVPFIEHRTEHKEKEKRTIKIVTLISTIIPTVILMGSWIKGIIVGWIQKPH